ncbi:unnamed protein product [Clonostachys chloroleuca]|uniref:Carboxylic ester hydrolase n=1 Tax=Clonostachys chloroleuca TaxID=1926264 RepID=A0AA35LTG1_9HYPO|nr:unnamed protein product [Clonostachys chloroleuca]
MSYQTPTSRAELQVGELGSLAGFAYSNGVRQFCGIPYGRISKRWTRAVLADSWAAKLHDGTKLGPSAPNPPEVLLRPNQLTPVPQFPHLPITKYSANDCLIMNIATPPKSPSSSTPFPVMVYIHGGAFKYGGANRSVFDGVNLVSFSMSRGSPVVSVALNYRVGIWGFLASRDIQEDLARDGFTGCGNFGLTDQKLALKWLQKYVSFFGGNPDDVTIIGESAGGTSVAMQLLSSDEPHLFHRAIQMSGGYTTLPIMTLKEHDRQYRLLLKRFSIDPEAPDALQKLREIPEEEVTACTLPLQGAAVCSYNPCNDGVILGSMGSERPTFDNFKTPPAWLKGFMVGDVADEAIIFRTNLPYTYDMIWAGLCKFLGEETSRKILDLYQVSPGSVDPDLRDKFEMMASDALFIVENFVMAHRSKVRQTFGYHFDQRSTLDNALNGTAYHAIDLLYLFRNLRHEMTDEQKALSDEFAGHFIDFAYGKDPWEPFSKAQKWMVYGPDGKANLKTEGEDDQVRHYQRTRQILDMGLYQGFSDAMDYIAWQRFLTK